LSRRLPAGERRSNSADFQADTPEGRELATKLKWLMLFRILMVTVLLGATVVVSADTLASLSDPLQLFLYGIIIGTYVLTLAYALLLPRMRRVRAFSYVQLAGDVIVSGALVLVTGGTESVFTFLFSLTIINGAILMYRQGALVIASFSAVCFLLIAGIEYGVFRLPGVAPVVERRQLYYVTFIHLATFYLVAILSSYLADQLRQAGRKLVEKQADLATLKALNDNIVSSLASGLLTVGDDGAIIAFNPSAARITGYAASDVLHRPLREVFPELNDVLFLWEEDARPARLETLFTRHDNARIFLEYAASPLLDQHGQELGKVVHFQDVTEIKMLESSVKRNERLATVGQMAAALAHEVRNPLASISGSAEVLGALPRADDSEKRLVDIVVRESERLNELITDFLGYARPRKPELAPVHLGTLVAETVEAFRQEAGAPGVQVKLDVQDEPWAEADGDQVRQVLWNLLRNAAEAMSEGGTVGVRVRRESANGRRSETVCVTVEDSGVGIPPENRHRIFDPFFTTRASGTGLGLSVVVRIVQDHDGEITLATPVQDGHGAAFTVRLRAAEAESLLEKTA